MFRIGCHLSASGGYARMARDAQSIGAHTFQFFTRNPRGGRAKDLDPEDLLLFETLAREAEIAGRIGTETTHRLDRLNESSGLTPTITWSTSGRIQIGRSFTVTVSADVDISFFIFQGHTLSISSTAEGTSEVYWKS